MRPREIREEEKMKKSKAKGRILLALILALCLLAAGCGQPSGSSGASKGAEPGETSGSGELEPYDLTWYVLGPAQQRDNQRIEQEINKYLKDKLNVTVKMNMLDWASYDQKLKAAIAASEPFDICFTGVGMVDYVLNSKNGAFMEMDGYLENEMKGAAEAVGEDFLNAARVNGHIYALPCNQEKAVSYGFVYNKTLADEYGIDMSDIKTYSDIEPKLQQFMEHNEELTPLFNDNSQNLPFVSIMEMGANPQEKIGMILPDGTVVNQYESEEYKAAYQQMRDFYNKGYLRKDVATMKDGQSQKSNGQFFTFPVNLKPCYADELNILAQGKGFTLAQVDVTDIYLTNALGSMQAISRTSKNPQRAAMFLELVNTDKYLNNLINFGVEGVDYEKVSDNVIKLIPDSGYAPNMQWMYGNQFLNFLNETEAPDKWEQFEAFNAKAKQLPDFGFIFDETPVQTEVAATLNIVKEYNNVLKVGAVDPEKTLPEFLNKLREAGSETIVAEMQKQFDQFKKGQE